MVAALASVLLLGVLILVHELGHFVVARWCGVRIVRFSIGFGRKIVGWTRGGTEYWLSWIPLGGYVKMAGEQHGERTQAPDEYLSKPVGTRAAIVAAGPFVNYLVALVSLWTVFVVGYPELLPEVGRVLEDMPASAAGLQEGDRILAVDGTSVPTWEAMTELIHASAGKPMRLRVARADAEVDVTLTPTRKDITDPFGRPKSVGLIGIGPSGAFETFHVGPIEAIGRTVHQHNEWVGQTLLALWSMATGRISVRESVTGPIGLLVLTSEAASMGIGPLLYLIALFSLSLAIFNVFPIPILDGGHLFFLLLEKLRGSPVSLNIQERAAQVSFVLLMTMVLFVCVNDVSRFGIVDRVMEWMGR